MDSVSVYTKKVPVAGELTGWVTVPTGFDPAKERLPLILFLHGAGERGTDLELVKVHGIAKLFCANPDYHGLRVITASPQCPEGMVWNHLAYQVKEWIEAVAEDLNADKGRISVTGLSMGGFGTWELLTTFPEMFYRGAPVCGGGMSWRAGALKSGRIRVFHGLDDACVPFYYSQVMVEAARGNGIEISLTAYDKVGHGSWVPAYEQSDLIEWLADAI